MKLVKGLVILLSALVVSALVVAAALFQLVWGAFTPIRFCGGVNDTEGHPVAAAQIYVSFAEFPYSLGIRDDTTSDESGDFTVWGHGGAVVIMTSKAGYYGLPESDGNFQIWPPGTTRTWPPDAGDYWHSSSSHPITFKLRKAGVCEPLVETGGDFGLNLKITGDGTPISMDLTLGRAYRPTTEDVRIQAWIDDQGIQPGKPQNFDWRFEISVPGGGIQPRIGEFDFQAPQSGYEPSAEIVVSASDPKWNSSATREYFLQLATGKFARIKLTTGVGSGNNGFTITSYLNPQPGHRDLEYDPALKVGQ